MPERASATGPTTRGRAFTPRPLSSMARFTWATRDGLIQVLALSKEKQLLASNDVDQPVHAGPVLANGVMYLAAGRSLYAIRSDGKTDLAPGHWPQWRGVDRANVARETGLLKRWPKDGPPLAWKVEGLGQGAASVAVAGGR